MKKMVKFKVMFQQFRKNKKNTKKHKKLIIRIRKYILLWYMT